MFFFLKERVHILEIKLDEAEQYSCRNCVEIQGVPVQNNDTIQTVKDVGKALGVDSVDKMIDACHTLGNKVNAKDTRGITKICQESRCREKRDFSTRHLNLASDNQPYLRKRIIVPDKEEVAGHDEASAEGTRLQVALGARRHQHPVKNFIDELRRYLQKPNIMTCKVMLILGDMNINILDDNSEIDDYKLTLACNGIESLINDPIRIMVLLKSSNKNKLEIEAILIDVCVSDHYMTAVCMQVVRLSYRVNNEQLIKNLDMADWCDVFQQPIEIGRSNLLQEPRLDKGLSGRGDYHERFLP
ncbi:hypothetical protein J6590_043116 [Homalodisca vitripennis]|nr:hypothetical protein J6590_043116 [Homalodisca vitripennis]